MMTQTRRSSRGALALIATAAILAGCSGAPSKAPVNAQNVINPARSDRGNPPFYEVFGERYYVLDTSDGFRQRGVASWYGPDFHGRTTSSGETYDMNGMTAAHKTLPIPTWVEVTNMANGRRVIVRVNDRGPFVDGRIIDLSRRAATELGMIEAGTARVQVRALGAPATPPALQTASTASESRGFSIISEARADTVSPDDRPYRPYYVQVGAFAERNNAEKLERRLKDAGFSDSFVLTLGNGRGRLHRVRLGPIEPDEFDRIRADLRNAGIRDSSLVQDN